MIFLIRWVFEKYDGIRGFWNPQTKTMYARTGRKLVLPQNVIDDMPQDLFLDGELWYVSSNSFILGLTKTTV